MKIELTALMILLTCSLQAQIIEKFSIDSGGDNFSNGSIQLLYTIGEVNVQELSTGNTIVSEGFINSSNSGTLGINNLHWSQNKIIVYPNPTSRFINISSEVSITKIEVFNLLGENIFTTYTTNYIDLTNLNSGIYMINIHTENGHVTKKIVLK
ncbi:T9SS type A sorting domain-containing protein [Sabulilitoribacter multivorans]|uniref:T9SS type A sorting domain-containing protein n=1 Tax=Flaviramulus multivorans TaxID=1304750 RepID=A0ABS9IMB2_9FLAO|nr:T9SS type A sorting domain-containing protein [Flaviramulus multivorans]MCF7561730.1 T9SS type A sorting domain-containing protein [Flaviramulus multivorans]